MRRPNFFIAGAPKSGTTALYEALAAHPDVFMCPEKEPLFFCEDLVQESLEYHGRRVQRFLHADRDAYLALFQDAGDERVVGEATTNYLFSKVAARRIQAFGSDARVLIVLREPVDFLVSLHAQYLREGVEPLQRFEEALEAELDRRAGCRLPPQVYYPSYLFYRERVRYAEHLGRFLDAMGHDRVLVLLFDDLKADSTGMLRRVLEFLELDAEWVPEVPRANPHAEARFSRLNRLILHSRLKHQLQRSLSSEGYARVKGLGKRLLLREGERAALLEAQRRALMEEFRPEVERLGELLQRDLVSLWGYQSAR